MTIEADGEDLYAMVSYESHPTCQYYIYGFTDDEGSTLACTKLAEDDKNKIFTEMVKHIAIHNTQPSDYDKINKEKLIKKYHAKSTDSQLDIAYLYIKNDSKVTLDESYSLKELKNVDFLIGKAEGEFKIEPGQDFLVVFKRKVNGPWSWK